MSEPARSVSLIMIVKACNHATLSAGQRNICVGGEAGGRGYIASRRWNKLLEMVGGWLPEVGCSWWALWALLCDCG